MMPPLAELQADLRSCAATAREADAWLRAHRRIATPSETDEYRRAYFAALDESIRLVREIMTRAGTVGEMCPFCNPTEDRK